MSQNELLQLLRDIKQFDSQNLLPQDIRDRIELALIAGGDLSAEEQVSNALHLLMDSLPFGTHTSMMVFRPDMNGQHTGAVKAFLIADNQDDLRAAQWIITLGSSERGKEMNKELERISAELRKEMCPGS